VIASAPGDSGSRPIPADQAYASSSVQANIANATATNNWSDFELQLSCVVSNLGVVPSPAALAEFYVGAAIGIWSANHDSLTPAQVQAGVELVGRAGFAAPAGTSVTVNCPVLWHPGSADAAQQGVLVQITDLFMDPWTAPFDALRDRHVARNDEVMDPIIF
jgi:hypothetical protein